ncbi:hypothetical protein GCM10020370_70930 [Paenibacillus hodogayensis]
MSARKAALQTVRTVSAADLACSETDFLVDKVTVKKAEVRAGHPIIRQEASRPAGKSFSSCEAVRTYTAICPQDRGLTL